MRLILPLIFGLLGAAVGVLVCKIFSRSWLAYPAAAILGAFSGFAGMIVRDALDMTIISSDTLVDTLVAAILMSLLVSIIANIVTSIMAPRSLSKRNPIDHDESQ